MKKVILNELAELVKENVISAETAQKIENYYSQRTNRSPDKLLIVFAVLGAILTGLGIILIIAHNWDDLSRPVKTVFAFVPLFLSQLICFYVLVKKFPDVAWRESSAAFLVLSIGAAISLISQIYNIPGSFSSFFLTWSLLALPVVYIMQSSVASLLYISGITSYGIETGYYSSPDTAVNPYWLLLLLIFPYYYILNKIKSNSNFTLLHHWFIPVSIIMCLGIAGSKHDEILFISYMSLFGFFYLTGKSVFFNEQKKYSNSYLILGSAGMMTILVILSFDWFWNDLIKHNFTGFYISPEFITTVITTFFALFMIFYNYQKKIEIEFPDFIFLFFILIFIAGCYNPVTAFVLINLLLLISGIMFIRKGTRMNHLGILNYGLTIVTALIIARFFDTELNFVMRGILFLIVGAGFFLLNYWMIKKRRSI